MCKMLTMLKINEVAETRKVVVAAIFWAADHHQYVSRGDRRPGRGRRGETGRARLALCALSEMSSELDDAKASFVVAEVVGLEPGMHGPRNQPPHAMWGAARAFHDVLRRRTGVTQHLHSYHAAHPPDALAAAPCRLTRVGSPRFGINGV